MLIVKVRTHRFNDAAELDISLFFKVSPLAGIQLYCITTSCFCVLINFCVVVDHKLGSDISEATTGKP